MKIICVAGGSYKSFYLNFFCKLKNCDLLIFNYGIIYDYDVKNELVGPAIVTKELLNLARKLNCVVVAGIYKIFRNSKTKAIIYTNGDKLHLSPVKTGQEIHIKNNTFIVGDEFTNYFNKNKIVLSSKKIVPQLKNCSIKKLYIFCDKFGTTFVKNKKLIRRFNKINTINI